MTSEHMSNDGVSTAASRCVINACQGRRDLRFVEETMETVEVEQSWMEAGEERKNENPFSCRDRFEVPDTWVEEAEGRERCGRSSHLVPSLHTITLRAF